MVIAADGVHGIVSRRLGLLKACRASSSPSI